MHSIWYDLSDIQHMHEGRAPQALKQNSPVPAYRTSSSAVWEGAGAEGAPKALQLCADPEVHLQLFNDLCPCLTNMLLQEK